MLTVKDNNTKPAQLPKIHLSKCIKVHMVNGYYRQKHTDVNRLVAENLDEHGAHAGGYSQEYDTYIRNLIQTELAQKPTGYNR